MIGKRIGHYEIASLLGKGGMGEVWAAHDMKLGRTVAIKTLPPEFAGSDDRRARSEREAQLLASLNHPNIGAIYGLEEFDGARCLVMELIEGETLADLVKRGPIPIEQALKIALQIAEALEAAHEKGIVHRDLKPANVKVNADGKVKVLDFGLAKAFLDSSSAPNLSNSPTFSMAATAQGVILGTAAYMSPEQARGASTDSRADVWAFGCVLYEMLTGRQAFQGETVSDILASVLARDPDYEQLPARLHPKLREVVHRCLEKDRKRRWQAIGDVRVEIERVLSDPSGAMASAEAVSAPPRAKLKAALPWAAAFVAGVALTWLLKPSPPAEPRPLVRFEYEIPDGQVFRGAGRNVLAVSPDGRYFAYNTTRGLLLRYMDATTAQPVPGTEEGSTNPFFSPDGEWIAYFAGGQLKKISVRGGAPVTLCPATNLFGASWGADGSILFAQPEGIRRVASDGGTPELVVPTENEVAYGPQLLPDGDHVLFSVTSAGGPSRWDQARVVVQSLSSGERTVVIQAGSDARYVSTGHIVYALGSVLFAVPFDLEGLKVTGGVVPIVEGIQRAQGPEANTAAANYGISKGGVLAYLNTFAAAATPDAVLAIVGRGGDVRRLKLPPGQYRHPRVSPDGRQVAVEIVGGTDQNSVWIYDLAENTALRRLTQGFNSTRPIWTPDSKRITFASTRPGEFGIFWQPADGSGLPERLTTGGSNLQFPESWSPDGRVLSFAELRGGALGAGVWSVWTVSMDAKDKPALFLDLQNSNEFGSVFSRDGKWIAYTTNGGSEGTPNGIYVQPYPPTGVKYQISGSAGAWPLWSPGGDELVYRLSLNDAAAPLVLNTVTIATNPAPTFSNERRVPITGFLGFVNFRDYDIMPNGREFVMLFPENEPSTAEPPRPRIQTVLNWFEELNARVPTGK